MLSNNFCEVFPKALLALRQEHSLSQLDLAKKAGTTIQSIYYYERGDRIPSVQTLEAMAASFNMDFFTFLIYLRDLRFRYYAK